MDLAKYVLPQMRADAVKFQQRSYNFASQTWALYGRVFHSLIALCITVPSFLVEVYCVDRAILLLLFQTLARRVQPQAISFCTKACLLLMHHTVSICSLVHSFLITMILVSYAFYFLFESTLLVRCNVLLANHANFIQQSNFFWRLHTSSNVNKNRHKTANTA